jgi:PTS system mannose-specific IIA component
VIGIVIVAHGGLSKEYLAAVEHVVGKQEGIATVAIEPTHDRHVKETEICNAAEDVDAGDGVVIVTDMFGGTPSNLSMLACKPQNRKIVYGANLPMLIKLATSRRMPIQTAIDAALTAGRKYIDYHDGTK